MLAQDGWRSAHPASGGASEERAYTGIRVRVLSAQKVLVYRPGANEVAIAIRGHSEKVTALSPRFVQVLPLVFDDTSPYATYANSGQDNPATISAEQADAVAAFVLRHRDRDALVIHCTAGVSRSRSLAAAVCSALRLPYEWTVVNDDVERTVLAAMRRASRTVEDEGNADAPLSHGTEDARVTTRPRPAWWYRLPVTVNSVTTLAAHMRETAAQCGGASTDWPQRALLTTAGLLDTCTHGDAACLQSVVANLDARIAAAPDDSLSGERKYWDALAHAVERIAESLTDAGPACSICGAAGAIPQGYRDPDLGDVALCSEHRDREMDWS